MGLIGDMFAGAVSGGAGFMADDIKQQITMERQQALEESRMKMQEEMNIRAEQRKQEYDKPLRDEQIRGQALENDARGQAIEMNSTKIARDAKYGDDAARLDNDAKRAQIAASNASARNSQEALADKIAAKKALSVYLDAQASSEADPTNKDLAAAAKKAKNGYYGALGKLPESERDQFHFGTVEDEDGKKHIYRGSSRTGDTVIDPQLQKRSSGGATYKIGADGNLIRPEGTQNLPADQVAATNETRGVINTPEDRPKLANGKPMAGWQIESQIDRLRDSITRSTPTDERVKIEQEIQRLKKFL